MKDGIRAFLALTLSDDARRSLSKIQRLLISAGIRVRWEPTEKLHVTVRFLGDISPASLTKLTRECETLARDIAPIDLVIDRLGAFPTVSSPRILWAGAFETVMLSQIGKAAEQAARTAGCAPDRRAFHPHCTLARVRERDSVPHLTNAFASITFDPVLSRSSELVLMKSVLQPGGSQYSELASFPFIRYRSSS